MKFTICRNVLSHAVALSIATVEKQAQNSYALDAILIEADKANGSLRLTTTNLTQRTVQFLSADILSDGKACLAAKRLLDILNASISETVTFSLSPEGFAKNRVEIDCNSTIFSMVSTTEENFPGDIVSPAKHTFRANLSEFAIKLSQVASIQGGGNPIEQHLLNSVNLTFDGSGSNARLILAATDRKIAIRTSILGSLTGNPKGESFNITIPLDAVSDVIALLGKAAATDTTEVEFSFNTRLISFEFPIKCPAKSTRSIRYSSKLLDVKYPDLRAVFESQAKTPSFKFGVPIQRFRDALYRVSLACVNSLAPVHMALDPETITLSGSSDVYGSARETIELIAKTPNKHSVLIMPVYLLSLLAKIKKPSVTFHFGLADAPFQIRCPEDADFQAIMVPIRSR